MNCRHSKLWSSFNGLCITETLSGVVEIFCKGEIISRPWCISDSAWTKENMTMMAHGLLNSLTPILLQAWAHWSHTDFGINDRIKGIISLNNCDIYVLKTATLYKYSMQFVYSDCISVTTDFFWCFKKRQHRWKRQVKKWQILFDPGLLQWSAVGLGAGPALQLFLSFLLSFFPSFLLSFPPSEVFFFRVYNFWNQKSPWYRNYSQYPQKWQLTCKRNNSCKTSNRWECTS